MCVFGVILVRIFPAFFRIRTEYGEIQSVSPYLARMRENAEKTQTRITPNTDTFYAVNVISFMKQNRIGFRDVFKTHPNFYDGTFLPKIVNGFSHKIPILDVWLGSKYVSRILLLIEITFKLQFNSTKKGQKKV